jgi:hypothetical protein
MQVLDAAYVSRGFVGAITQNFESRKTDILSALHALEGTPFTIQRIAELLTVQVQFRIAN